MPEGVRVNHSRVNIISDSKLLQLAEKLEKLSPTDRNKILQMVDIMLGEQ